MAGYASIGELIDLIAEWHRREHEGELHVLLGAEPFATTRATFRDPAMAFTGDGQVDQAVAALEASRAGKVARVRPPGPSHGSR